MNIPYCYDPVYQEEQRQWKADARSIPCDCCGHRIRIGNIYYQLNHRKEVLTICEDCKSEIDLSEQQLGGEEDV